MNINGFEKLSMVDFPGVIAATVFTSGCNFRCPFCHNAGIVDFLNGTISETEVLAYLTKRKGVIKGLCISGGEPTLQIDLEKFIKKVKSTGASVKLDTNGTNPILLKKLINANLIDYVAMDIKNSLLGYGKTCGREDINLNNILESIEILKENKIPYEFRTTLVQEFHTEESIKEMAKLLQGAEKLYLQQFVKRETCIDGNSLHAVSKQAAEKFASILKVSVNKVCLRGYN